MKHLTSLLAAALLTLSPFAINHSPLLAVNYCAPSSWGYAGTSVTGGTDATPTLVKSESELKNALGKAGSVIIITQDITVTNHISTDKNNLTIMALPGKKLISKQQNKEYSGILYLKGTNLLLRNLTFEGPGAYDVDGWDNLCLDGASKVWVDHCDFQDGCDGNFDIKGNSDNITVTWCRFRYLKAPRARECDTSDPECAKLTDDHRFSNLIGSSSSQKPSDGTYNITYAFCWWDEGCKQRMTRCRNCELHFLNCYWNSSVADYYVGPENAKCYFEGCTFAGKANSAKGIWSPFSGSTNYCTFVNCTGNLPSNSGSVSAPAYRYDQLSAATAKNHVTNACGAGATLTVTNTAEVSSSCDNQGSGGQGEQGGSVSGDCCIDMTLGEEPTVSNGGIPAEFSQLSITASLSTDESKGSKWVQGYLNMGANSDYVTFDFSAYTSTISSVSFAVTIPNWAANKNTIAYHWNNESNSQYEIAGAETETVSLTAPEGAKSFTIQRSAGTGTRISQVCFTLKAEDTTGLGEVRRDDVPCTKFIENGVLYLMYNGTMYNVQGQRVM